MSGEQDEFFFVTVYCMTFIGHGDILELQDMIRIMQMSCTLLSLYFIHHLNS